MSQNYLSLRQARYLPSHDMFGKYLFRLLKSENFEVTYLSHIFRFSAIPGYSKTMKTYGWMLIYEFNTYPTSVLQEKHYRFFFRAIGNLRIKCSGNSLAIFVYPPISK